MPLTTRGLMLADYVEQWLEVMRCRLRPTTFAGYELCLGRAVRMLGSVPIARLTPQLIQSCYAGLLIWKDLSSVVTDPPIGEALEVDLLAPPSSGWRGCGRRARPRERGLA